MKKTIQKAKALAVLLLTELEDMTGNAAVLNQLGDLMGDPEGNRSQLEDQIQETYRKAVSLPARAETMKNLADALKTIATLEREVSGTGKGAT